MCFQMKLHYNQTLSKILTQQKFSIYHRPSASTSHHLIFGEKKIVEKEPYDPK